MPASHELSSLMQPSCEARYRHGCPVPYSFDPECGTATQRRRPPRRVLSHEPIEPADRLRDGHILRVGAALAGRYERVRG